jgi:CRISPR system Cascade subunit CasE
MFLSKLTLNPAPGARQVQRDLADPYQMHRTILRAFPQAADGGPGRVLFRVEPLRTCCPPVVVVQSDKHPDWSALEAFPGYLLSAESKEVTFTLRDGQPLRFRLRANPTVKRDGMRHALVKYEDQCAWLARKADGAGFESADFAVRRAVRLMSWRGNGKKQRCIHLAVDYEGILRVTEPERFADAVAAGIGPGKAFGCGLLSVAPVRM